MLLSAKDLQLRLDGREIYSIDDFTLHPGEAMALIGPNGAGKSSLLLTLALIRKPTGGQIYFKGQVVSAANLLAIRRRLALVFQEALLLDTTVWKNLKIALRIRGISGDAADVRAKKWLERFGITHLAHRQGRQLSGGEAQRASLARAFSLEPDVLFLDEPFASLDYPTRKTLLKELGGIIRQMGIATVFVTHDPTEIPYLASRVLVLQKGRIVKSGTVDEVLGDRIGESEAWLLWQD